MKEKIDAYTGSHFNAAVAEETIAKIQELDALDNVFVVLSHDSSLLDIVDFFPQTSIDFIGRGWKEKAKWAFFKDFKDFNPEKSKPTENGDGIDYI